MERRLTSMGDTCPAQLVDRRISDDGARKYVVRLHDGSLVETVGMPHGDPDSPNSLAVCFSTQVGCAMGCAFCATGRQGLTRNLSADEILAQVALVGEDFGRPADSAVAMGQGEPLANRAELVEAIRTMADPEGFGIHPGKLAISTCGIPGGIRSLALEEIPATLVVSLHAATQELRDRLMPGVSCYPLEQLREELARYCESSGKHAVVQYLMLDGVNDTEDDLESLVSFCAGLDVHIDLLRYNPVEGFDFAPSDPANFIFWAIALERRGYSVRINRPRGTDIDAGCGQLANRVGAGG